MIVIETVDLVATGFGWRRFALGPLSIMLMTNQVRAGLVLLGMFFPWLEYRDHGTPGWVLFKNKMFFITKFMTGLFGLFCLFAFIPSNLSLLFYMC